MIGPYQGSGIVLDIGTGDGRFVSCAAKVNPDKFYIGIDANAKALEKLSTKITRKPAKGGLSNAMFVQSAAEDLPEEFGGIASEIYVNFPWGSLLRAVAVGDSEMLSSLRRIAAPSCQLNIVFGIDPTRDRSEIIRLELPGLSQEYLQDELLHHYQTAGFKALKARFLDAAELRTLTTSWARNLQAGSGRVFAYLSFQAV